MQLFGIKYFLHVLIYNILSDDMNKFTMNLKCFILNGLGF